MKIRESGMPEQNTWESFFAPDRVLQALGLTAIRHDAIEFGCGYGTFTLPLARRVAGTVHALDIDATMIATARQRAREQDIHNINFVLRDFVEQGTGLPTGSVEAALLFNILHNEDPVRLLREAHRILNAEGLLAIVHWNHDPNTPRGPPLDIRPRPSQCRAWAEQAGFGSTGETIDLPPYHFGLTLRRA